MSFNPGGGGGSSSISSSADVALSNPTGKDVLYYDSTIQKWVNSPSVATLEQTAPVSFATLSDAQTAGQNGQLAIGQLVVIG